MSKTKSKLGKRPRQTMERDDAIKKAAMALARRKTWPSPPEVANKTGISESVIERETALLLDARRKWEEVTGLKHPQWRDPEAPDAAPPKPPATKAAKASVDPAVRYRERLAQQKRTIDDLKDRLMVSEEEVRRLLLGVRPPELDAILKAAAPKRSKGKSKKRGGVGT